MNNASKTCKMFNTEIKLLHKNSVNSSLFHSPIIQAGNTFEF
jgi:hypothetical protein